MDETGYVLATRCGKTPAGSLHRGDSSGYDVFFSVQLNARRISNANAS